MRIFIHLVTVLLISAGACAETQAQHDKRTNFDGYGSAQNRYENLIMQKTHDSILKGGGMEYWNGLDEYYYRKYSMKKRVGQRRGYRWRSR